MKHKANLSGLSRASSRVLGQQPNTRLSFATGSHSANPSGQIWSRFSSRPREPKSCQTPPSRSTGSLATTAEDKPVLLSKALSAPVLDAHSFGVLVSDRLPGASDQRGQAPRMELPTSKPKPTSYRYVAVAES